MKRARFLGVMVGLVAAVLVAGALWLVLYAPPVANEPKIIQARNAYFDQLDKWGAVDALFYTFRPLAILEDGERPVYKYKWIGHLARMEYAEKVLVGSPTSPAAVRFFAQVGNFTIGQIDV